ncbi:kinesin-like protein KIN-13A, partial [Tanacetum coccineum]
LVVKKHNEVRDTRRNNNNNNDSNESKGGKVVGKISFIDLAGSERGANTTDNDRQTRSDLAPQRQEMSFENVTSGLVPQG